MIYETHRLLNAREIVRIVGKGHVAFFLAWYFNYFRDICISSLSSTNISACQISNSDQISCTNLSDCLLQIWSDFGGNGNAKIRTKCGKMYVSLALGNFTRRYYPTTVIHEARIDFHEVSNVKKRKKSKEKKERRKRKKRRNARGACIVRELSPPMVF